MFLVVVLVTTGASLVLTYAPGREQALGLTQDPPVSPTRLLHRVAGLALVLVAVGLVIASLARQRWRAVSALVLVLVAALVWTGYRLPWDQLALSATRLAGEYRGMISAAYDANVDIVRIGGRQVPQGDFRAVLLTHVVVLPVAVATAGLLAARLARRGGRRVGSSPTGDDGAGPPPAS